jgi:hypothetical protein
VVVCVDASGIYEEVKHPPVEGGVYTVRALRPWGPGYALLLTELHNEPCLWADDNFGEIAFLAERFRPAVQTSLDVFEKMLAPSPKEMEPA